MSIAKVIEVIAESEDGWEAAAENAVREASRSVDDVKHLWVKNMQAEVRDGRIVNYKLNANVTFIVHGDD